MITVPFPKWSNKTVHDISHGSLHQNVTILGAAHALPESERTKD
jgi:hypothetical protein